MAKRISETIYSVRELDLAIQDCVEKLGFVLLSRQDWGWAELGLGESGPKLGLLRIPEGSDPIPPPRLGIQTDRFEEELQELKAQGVRVERLPTGAGSTKAANIFDADGNAFFLWDDGSSVDG